MKMWVLAASVALAASLGVGAAFAQTQQHRAVEAPPGGMVQVGYYGSANRKDCTPAPLPRVDVRQAPKHGTLIVRQAKLRTERVQGCDRIEVPAQVVFYRSSPGYAGPDRISYEIAYAQGERLIVSIDITVKEGASGGTTAPGPRGGGLKL